MCYDAAAAPPVFGAPLTTVTAAPTILTSADGAPFGAFDARPDEPASGAGVVILPDNRGLAAFYEQLAIRLAEQGHRAVAIDYFGRTAGANYRDRDDTFEISAHQTKLTRPGMQDDMVAAVDTLGADGASVVALGFCMGGRLAFFAAAPSFGLAGAIGFYGVPGIAGPYGPGPTQHAAELRAPILGLFGEADGGIPLSEVAAFDAALGEAGVPHEIVTYPGAGHGFFDVQQDQHLGASADAWQRVVAFLDRR